MVSGIQIDTRYDMVEKEVTIKLIKGNFEEWKNQEDYCWTVVRNNNGQVFSREWNLQARTRKIRCRYPSETDYQNAIREIDRHMTSKGFTEICGSSTDILIKKIESVLFDN